MGLRTQYKSSLAYDDIMDSLMKLMKRRYYLTLEQEEYINNLAKKLFKVSANDFEISQEFIYDLADYSSSWLWVGVANPLDSCPEEHRHYFKGDISFCGVFQTYMDSKDIKRVFDGKWEKSDRPVAVYNFEKLTPYKVLDITKNGNNLINYDKRWMDEN